MKKLPFGFMLILIGCSSVAQQPENKTSATMPTVHTNYGDVQGVTEGEVSIFKAIPYAAAPVGEYRWRPPQPVTPWKVVRDARKECAICPQRAWPGSKAIMSEDCLLLNVWTPATAAKQSKLP
jgi:para-nitrobenzyl esterase